MFDGWHDSIAETNLDVDIPSQSFLSGRGMDGQTIMVHTLSSFVHFFSHILYFILNRPDPST